MKPFGVLRRTDLALAVILVLIAQAMAVGKRLPWDYLPLGSGRALWILLTLVGVLAWQKSRSDQRSWLLQLLSSKRTIQAWAALNLTYLWLNHLHFESMGYTQPWFSLVAVACCLPLLGPGAVLPAFGLNLLVLIGSIFSFPINPLRSDMLPVIAHGLDALGSGRSPFEVFDLAGRANRMGYLPGTLFLHLPASLLGVDLRWNSVFYRLIWMILVWRKFLCKEASGPTGIACIYLALSPYLNFRHDLYFDGFWVLLLLLVIYPRARFLTIPLAVVTRQWAWVVTPFWLLLTLQESGRSKIREILYQIAGLAGVLIGLWLVLRMSTPWAEFLRAIFWFQGAAQAERFSGDYGLTLAPVLFAIGHAGLLQKIQALGMAFLGGWALYQRNLPGRLWTLSVIGWAFFLLFTPHYWSYFWASFCYYLIAVSLIAPPEDPPKG